jgi:hypothetical protein
MRIVILTAGSALIAAAAQSCTGTSSTLTSADCAAWQVQSVTCA